MADNREFAEQIAGAIASLGTTDALSCMGRVMCWVAADHGHPLQFDCDLGVVVIEPQPLPLDKVEQVLKNKQREHSYMLKRAGELQERIAKLTSELTELGYPPPPGSFAATLMSVKGELTGRSEMP